MTNQSGQTGVMSLLRRKRDPLDEIERGAIDPGTDLVTLLRKCIVLGGRTGSTELRDWAAVELGGYGPDDDVPEYRMYVAPLLMDAMVPGGKYTGHLVSADMIPDDETRNFLTGDLEFRQPISQLVELRRDAKRDQHGARLAPPGMDILVTLMNAHMAGSARVERVYWSIEGIVVGRTVDAVRTKLVSLVAEMRAATPAGQALPSGEATDQAVRVAVFGWKNRTIINQVTGASGDVSSSVDDVSGATPETTGRRIGFWLTVLAGVVAAGAGVAALLL